MHADKTRYDCPNLMKHAIGWTLPRPFVSQLEGFLNEMTDETLSSDRLEAGVSGAATTRH